MRLLTRVSVLLLAVALVPLLRFIDLDTCRNASAAPYPVEGISDGDSPGVVVDRKQNLRFVTRVRAAAADDDARDYDDDALVASLIAWEASLSVTESSAARSVLAWSSATRGTPRARGPPA